MFDDAETDPPDLEDGSKPDPMETHRPILPAAPPDADEYSPAAVFPAVLLDASPETAESSAAGETIDDEAPASPDGVSETSDEPPETARSETLEAFEALLRKLDEGFAGLERAFENKLAYDAHKEQQIDALHRELQEHKRGLLGRAVRPLLTGMVRLHDNLGRKADEWRDFDSAEPTFEQGARALEEFQDDLEIVLEENGVDLFRVPSERFEPRRQTAIRTLETSDPEKVGRIARRLRPGFERDGQLVQKERVEVWTAAEAATEPPSLRTENDSNPDPAEKTA